MSESEAGSGIGTWRERALVFVLWVTLAASTLPLLVILVVAPDSVHPGYRVAAIAIGAVVLAVALARRLPHAARAWGFVLAALALAVAMLLARGLAGSGRLVLVAAPLYATVLVGPRSGFAAAALALAVYAATAAVVTGGVVSPLAVDGAGPQAGQFWLLQGATLGLVLAPVLVLVTRFIAVLQAALAGERAAAARIAEADRERRHLERVLLETGERERRGIGHQLHDGPCQELAAALLRCQVAQRTLAGRGAHDEAAHVGAVAEMLDASLGEIHDLARGLSPAELSPAALADALRDLAARVRSSAALECEVRYDGFAQPASAEVSTQLFRIAQEAVSNAVRHARPQRVTIALDREGRGMRLTVRDDGAGMSGAGDAGMGLRIMRYRAELIGATLEVAPADGGGTAVTCSLPHAVAAGHRGTGA